MKRYKDWGSTLVDTKGLGCFDFQEWFVAPVVRTRDDDALERSNWRVVTRDLMQCANAENTLVIQHTRHWACGWFELMLIEPNSEAYKCASEWEIMLKDYPIACEEDYASEEFEEHKIHENH